MLCPSCNYANRDDALVCNLCKTVLRRQESTPPGQVEAAPPAPAVEEEERVDLALRELGGMVFAAMPATPRGRPRRVTISTEKPRFPDVCPGCGERAGSKLELVSPWNPLRPSEPRARVRVPFCRRCVQLVARRRSHLAGRAIVIAVGVALAVFISTAVAAVLAVELARIAWLGVRRAWYFGAGAHERATSLDQVALAIDDAGYAEALAALNPPAAPETQTPAADAASTRPKVARAPAIERVAPGARAKEDETPDGSEDKTPPPTTERYEEEETLPGVPRDPVPAAPPPVVAPPAIHDTIPNVPPGTFREESGAPPPLPDEAVHPRVLAACSEGDELMRDRRFVQALVKYEEALASLAPPVDRWKIATRIHASLGEAYFQLGDWPETRRYVSLALASPAGAGDPALLLRLGQSLLELGDTQGAKDTLTSAYLAGGETLISGAPEKYRAVLGDLKAEDAG